MMIAGDETKSQTKTSSCTFQSAHVMQAFCPTPILVARNPSCHTQISRQNTVIPCCAAKPSQKSKQSRSNSKRPRSTRSGFGKKQSVEKQTAEKQTAEKQTADTASKQTKDSSKETEEETEGGPDLQKIDSNGISLEHRLREEIVHPLRKPKQTLFATLAFSATLGFFFAVTRYITKKDAFGDAAKNVAIDIAAIALFAFLTWREFEFGRRSLNSIAGRPQARDLPIVRLNGPSLTIPLLSKSPRLAELLGGRDLLIVAGRRTDVLKYIGRCVASASEEVGIVAFPIDGRDSDAQLVGADAIASGETDKKKKDWITWLGDAIPPRRNVALFKIEKGDNGNQAANAYIVAVDDPTKTPLPAEVKRPEVVDV